MSLIRARTHETYAAAILREGINAVAAQAWTRTGPCAKASRWLINVLWENEVITHWHFEVDEHYFEPIDPDTQAPLFIEGPRWSEFMAECYELGLCKVRTRRG